MWKGMHIFRTANIWMDRFFMLNVCNFVNSSCTSVPQISKYTFPITNKRKILRRSGKGEKGRCLPWSKEEEGEYIFWMKQVPVEEMCTLKFGLLPSWKHSCDWPFSLWNMYTFNPLFGWWLDFCGTIRRLAREGGVKRMSGLVYAETRFVTSRQNLVRTGLGLSNTALLSEKQRP
jgi:hypothetical protein